MKHPLYVLLGLAMMIVACVPRNGRYTIYDVITAFGAAIWICQ